MVDPISFLHLYCFITSILHRLLSSVRDMMFCNRDDEKMIISGILIHKMLMTYNQQKKKKKKNISVLNEKVS